MSGVTPHRTNPTRSHPPTTKRNETKPSGAPPPGDREKPTGGRLPSRTRRPASLYKPPAAAAAAHTSHEHGSSPFARVRTHARTLARSPPEQSAPAPLAPLPEGPAAAAGDGAEEDPGVRLQAPPPGAPQAPRRHRPPDPLRAGHFPVSASSPAARLLPAARRLSYRRMIWGSLIGRAGSPDLSGAGRGSCLRGARVGLGWADSAWRPRLV